MPEALASTARRARLAAWHRTPALTRLTAPLGVAVLAGAGCAAVWWGDPMTAGGPLPVCPSKALFGIDCPGCGGLRMMYSLLHGDLGAAVHFNAVALAALPVLVGLWGAWLFARWRGRRLRAWPRWAVVLVLAVVLAWFVARNIPVAPFTALHV
jgi:hypothetical protein